MSAARLGRASSPSERLGAAGCAIQRAAWPVNERSSPARAAAISRRAGSGAVPTARQWNRLVEERVTPAKARPGGARRAAARTDTARRHRRRQGEDRRTTADRRARSRARRRRRAGLGGADRRRSGHRQVDARPAGARRARRARARRSTSRARSRRSRSRCAPTASASREPQLLVLAETSLERILEHAQEVRAGRCSPSTRSRPCSPSSSPRRPAASARCARAPAQLVPLAKRHGAGHLPGRPRHQGRRVRRPARARAHGRHGALLRGRPRPLVPHPARGEEPLRLDQRDRRLRDEGERARSRWPTRRRCSSPSGRSDVPGSVVVASIEGTRPILVELQALVSPSSFGTPRRTTLGIDPNRVALLVAVLEKKMGLHLHRPRHLRQRRRRRAHRRAGGRSRRRRSRWRRASSTGPVEPARW